MSRHRCGREQGLDVGINGGGRAHARVGPGGVGAAGRRGASVITEQAAAERVAEALAERDAIQANLLELDGSFAKQVLEGATLSGTTRDRWATAFAALATLWETFLAYSAVIDRVAALGTGPKRPARKDLPEPATCSPVAASSCQAPRAARPQGPCGHRPAAGHPGRRRRRDAPAVHPGNRGDLGR